MSIVILYITSSTFTFALPVQPDTEVFELSMRIISDHHTSCVCSLCLNVCRHYNGDENTFPRGLRLSVVETKLFLPFNRSIEVSSATRVSYGSSTKFSEISSIRKRTICGCALEEMARSTRQSVRRT